MRIISRLFFLVVILLNCQAWAQIQSFNPKGDEYLKFNWPDEEGWSVLPQPNNTEGKTVDYRLIRQSAPNDVGSQLAVRDKRVDSVTPFLNEFQKGIAKDCAQPIQIQLTNLRKWQINNQNVEMGILIYRCDKAVGADKNFIGVMAAVNGIQGFYGITREIQNYTKDINSDYLIKFITKNSDLCYGISEVENKCLSLMSR